jgi:hypothetical protein
MLGVKEVQIPAEIPGASSLAMLAQSTARFGFGMLSGLPKARV